MAGVDKMILRGVDMWKGQYFKRKGQNSNPLTNTPIHFVPKSEKTEDWKASVSDYYEHIGLAKVSYSYDAIIKNRWLSSGKLDILDYKKSKKTSNYEILEKNGINYKIESDSPEDLGFDFYPLIPNLVNLFTGYQLKRNNKFIFSLVDEFSKAELFDIKDVAFKTSLKKIMMEMRDNSLNEQDPNYQKQHEELINAQLKFKNYKDVAVEWANRVHKINYEKFGLRNLIKQAFKESYLNSSKVIFHINMLKDRFLVEHIDELFAFNAPIPNSTDLTEGDYIGWFKWMNIGELLDNFGKVFCDEDIEKLKEVNRSIANGNFSLVDPFNVGATDRTGQGGTAAVHGGYDPSKPYEAQPNEPLDIARYKRHLEQTTGLTFNNQTVSISKNPDINPEFHHGQDKLYRVMYLYLKSQRRIGWLTKINKTGQIEFQNWVNEDYKITENPVYDNSTLKVCNAETLVYGEHIDWEWLPDWRRFITLSPNSTHSSFNSFGINLEKIYIDGNSLDFQFKNDLTPYGVKPPVVGIEIKQRGVKAVPVVSLLKQDQVIFNICKNRVRQVLAQDRGLVLAYNTNTISRFDSDIEDDGDLIKNYEDSIRKHKVIRQTYDKQWLQGAGGQMSAPTILNLSTLDEALKYDQLSERVWYNALRTVGVTPQAMGEIKASEEVSNANAAQQISQVQTELIYDEFNSRLLPALFQKILEATQYYTTINEDFKLMYLNDNEENTWLDVTGINLLHKDFMCTAKYTFDNEEFTSLVKKLAFDNTIQESMLTRLKVFAKADDNISKVLTILEESEQKAQEDAQKLEDAKREDLQKQQEHEQLLLDKELENTNTQKELDRQSKEYIASLGILGGGLQTDANTNSEIDSLENFKMVLKQREMQNKQSQLNISNELAQKMHSDNITLKKEQILQKDRSDDKKLKQAVVNRNAASDKSLDKKVLKK